MTLFALLWLGPGLGCALPGGWDLRRGSVPFRISEVVDQGDAARRASLRLVIDGLDADAAGLADRARGGYERAIQVDPTNPYAYLAIARHHVDGTDPSRALPFLDQAEALFRAQGEISPRVEAHLTGLRGEAFYVSGQIAEGVSLLERARESGSRVWEDGHLSATELR